MAMLDPLPITIRTCRAIIWLAAWMVPQPLRSEWVQKRRNETWHWANFLAESGKLDSRNLLELQRHCWGAFGEAFWLRFDRETFTERKRRLLRSPVTCLAVCFTLLFVLMLSNGFLTGSAPRFSSPVVRPDRVAVVSFNGKYVRIRSETLLYLGSVWKSSQRATEMALYSWSPTRLSDGNDDVPVIESRVAPEFFQLLGVRPLLGRLPQPGTRFECVNCVVLSNAFWRVHFHGDRQVLGRTVQINGQPKTIIGVLPDALDLPASSTAVWTVLDEATLRFTNFMSRVGAVARLRDGATPEQLKADLIDRSENVGYRFVQAPMSAVSVKSQFHRLVWAYVGFMFLALACAGWIAWVLRSGTGGVGPVSLNRRQQLRWWGFFVAKSAGLTGCVFLLVWLAVHRVLGGMTGTIYPMADEVGLWTFLPIAVAILSWSIADQQKRCRVCLSRLVLPVEVGRPGSVLLNFAGTELVCAQGHGTLYVSESASNALERDRWNALDDSWAGLFRAG